MWSHSKLEESAFLTYSLSLKGHFRAVAELKKKLSAFRTIKYRLWHIHFLRRYFIYIRLFLKKLLQAFLLRIIIMGWPSLGSLTWPSKMWGHTTLLPLALWSGCLCVHCMVYDVMLSSEGSKCLWHAAQYLPSSGKQAIVQGCCLLEYIALLRQQGESAAFLLYLELRFSPALALDCSCSHCMCNTVRGRPCSLPKKEGRGFSWINCIKHAVQEDGDAPH